MDLIVIGINHKTAPVEIREKLSFSPKEIIEANRLLKESVFLKESLILSTCNRVEIYALCDRGKDYLSGIKSFLGRYHGLGLSEYEERMYVREGREAVEHLFSVAAGLDSMVIGEMEISGQVKKAYQDARQGLSTGKVLNRLFEKALNTAKKIRTKTFIGQGAVSVSSVAVRLAEKILGRLDDKTVLIIGTGAVGEQLLLYLRKNDVKSILVTNRTLEKAQGLADTARATAVAFENFLDRLVDVDIVIASAGAPHHIIHKNDIASLMPRRKQQPLFIIDLAVPRDVDAGVNTVDNAYLYDIDDLKRIVDENMSLRKNELGDCSRIIGNAADIFMGWMAKENPAPSYRRRTAEEGVKGEM
ncbi:MAG: glutamyl-tRNA reductase [Omnitrophica bacterium RIFCSPHIGHO2_02_FULL_46_20]|nr:MAG: glutamyl-tRNA reductase [Omnitrophica bacterium RIFCSPHIGHO2_02_FULL_46_20]